ncbi:zinc finger protein basonuclin-2 isoform X2 [Dendroctonus ponderosae]|nr:zinc finger protein basonuclin-2 isoform X2 [Dendroctonus ponderosae]XP_019765433.1 zinc finger protein basonuclin-2 isoform X2 [Dendroctonus ponderosae]
MTSHSSNSSPISSNPYTELTKNISSEITAQILQLPPVSSVGSFDRRNYQPPKICKQIRCTIPNCNCENFIPGKLRLRYCETCNHGWVPHALDKLGLRHLFNISAPEPVHVNVAFDVASLILYGCQALPIRLKILLDRLFSVLQKDEVIQVLHGFGWTSDDYARGYILQESYGSTLDRWSICNPEEEPLVLQQFLRFGETRAITQQLLLAQQALQERTLERLERRHSPHHRAMSPSRRPSPPNVHPSVFHSQVHAMSPHQKHPLGFLKMPPVSNGPISSNTPPNTMASSPLNRLQSMTFDYRKLSSAGLPAFPNRVSPDVGRRRTDNESVGLNLSISTSLANCLPPPHPPTSLSHSAAAMAVSANALAAANLVASSFPALMSTRMSTGSKSPSSAELFPGNANSEEDDDADENSHSALNLSRDRDSLKNLKQPRLLPGRKPSSPTKRQWGSPSLPLNLGTQFINPATGKKRVQCNVCLKTFCDKGALKIHFSAVHLREMHKCTVEGCNMMFSSRRSRNRHSANPNPKLHSPHLRRKISPHDGRSSQSHPILIPPQTGLGLPAAAALNPLNPFGPFPLLTPPPDMKYHSLATMDFKQTLDLSIQRSIEESKTTVKDFSALALTSSNNHHQSDEDEDDEEGIVVVGGDDDDDIPNEKNHYAEKEEMKYEQRNSVERDNDHIHKSPSQELRPSLEASEVVMERVEIPRAHSPIRPQPISDQPEDFSMPAKKQKMSISDADEEILSNIDSNEDSLSIIDNQSLKDEVSSVPTNKRKRKSQNPTRCALPPMLDDPVSDGDSSSDVFAERLAESTRRLEMEAKIEPKREVKEENRCESPLDLGKRSPDVNANEREKVIGSEIKTSLAPLFSIDKLKKEKLNHDFDAAEDTEDRPASSVESNKSDESFDSSNALRHLESLSHGNFSEWMSKGLHLGLGAPGSQFPPLGFMMSGGPPSPARSQTSSAGSSNGGESADENSQNQLYGHFDNGQFISTMDVPIDKDNPRRCTACGKIFQNHFGVKTHYQNVHLKLMHKCNVDGCNAAFPSKRSRDRHSANLNLHRKLLSTSSDKGSPGLSPFASFATNPALHGDFLARLYADEAFKNHHLPPNIDQLMLNGDRIPPPPLLLPPPLGVLPFPLGNFSHFGQFNGSSLAKERSSTSSSPVSSSPPPSNVPSSPPKYIHCVEEDLPTPDKEGNLPCRFCRTSFSTQLQLKEHCEKNHLSEMFKCTIIGCPKVFVSRTRRNIHSENESLHVKKESDVS